IFIHQEKYVADILKKFDLDNSKLASTPFEPQKIREKNVPNEPISVHLYRSMIGCLMYLTATRPDIMSAVCAAARHQVTPKTSTFCLDYAGANGDRKSTIGGCQFLGRRLISWQCKKQTLVATSTCKAEYVAVALCCSQVQSFDMLSGGPDVHWWGAVGDNYDNLTSGFVISDYKFKTKTYKNQSFTVGLISNVTWDNIKIVSIWKTSTASNFRHVVLKERSEAPTPAPTPSSNVNFTGSTVVEIDGEPTMFDNCKVLSDTYRLRWTLRSEDNVIDIGLEGAIDIQKYMDFRWADLFKEHDHMLGADVAVTGFTEKGTPFVDDYHITKYTRGEKKSGYLAIGFGSKMVNSFAYVGWLMLMARVMLILTGLMAMGTEWSSNHLTRNNMYSRTSTKPVWISLIRGSAEAEEDLRPVLANTWSRRGKALAFFKKIRSSAGTFE
nr:cytochrome b561, DM13 and DOMON domain-containing protein At5g54830 [Tanacetum cinerariifolium]